MKLIDVSTTKYPNTFAMVDDEDFEFLNQWKWHASKRPHTMYAVRFKNWENGKRPCVIMHRVILGAKAGKEVDHIDGNGLNNTRENIRVCETFENRRNQFKRRGLVSKYKGVSWCKGKWVARIKVFNKHLHLGRFVLEDDAARAYDAGAMKHHKEFANLNFKK